MRKNISFVFLALVLCLLALTGCSKMRAFERDVQVVLDVNGEMTGYVTVNIFNNAVIKEPQAPANTVFRGWTLQDSWTQEESSNVPIIQNKGLVRYNDIKDALKNDQRSIVIHAVFAPIPRRDLVIAWYAKEATSGLNQGHIDVLRDKLYEYLRSEGYKPESMDIAFRGYDGGVADTCAAINKDGDVDITVGWSSSSNLTGTGGWTEGVDFKENTGSITIGAKARYSARISDTDLSKKVYAWILSTFGPTEAPAQSSAPAPAAEAAPAQTPAAQAPAADESTLVIGWYAKTGTSGMDQATADALEKAVRHYLDTNGHASVSLTFRPYEGNVADVQSAVLANGDVDLMVAMKAFALEGIEMEVQNDVVVGEKTDRRIHRVSSKALAAEVFTWLSGEEARAVLATGAWEAPAESLADESVLIIGWYAKTGTSGLDESIIKVFESGLKAYLENSGNGSVSLVIRPYEGNVADVQSAVLANGDVDLMVGMKAFALEGIEMEVQNDVAMGPKTDRRIHRISDKKIAIQVFEWLKTEEARKLFVSVQ
jgi:hypothetical protein